ncbi:MAG: GtrA family protein [Lachnospiraceae bacterium]|nr:GtrA family protein [Lachnospiraceae bacterium]
MINLLWRGIRKLAIGFLRLIFKILHKDLTKEKEEGFVQFVKFGLVGLSNTVISYVTYVIFLFIFEKAHIFPEWDYLIAQGLAFVISVAWSFYWNNKYVFKEEEGEKRNIFLALLKTYASYAFTGLFLNSVLSYLWVDVLHWSKLIAPIINLLVSVPVNFFMNKLWAFRTKKKE